ncbi:hypothetical protein SprV_0301002800 [Sparganum proliferum]
MLNSLTSKSDRVASPAQCTSCGDVSTEEAIIAEPKECESTQIDITQQVGDLILVYKIIPGLEHGLNFEDMLQWHLSPSLRGHPMKLRTTMSRLNLRSEFFTQRVVEKWNDLPQAVVEATSLQLFKERSDDYLCPLSSLDSLNLN